MKSCALALFHVASSAAGVLRRRDSKGALVADTTERENMPRGSKASRKRDSAHKTDGDGVEISESDSVKEATASEFRVLPDFSHFIIPSTSRTLCSSGTLAGCRNQHKRAPCELKNVPLTSRVVSCALNLIHPSCAVSYGKVPDRFFRRTS